MSESCACVKSSAAIVKKALACGRASSDSRIGAKKNRQRHTYESTPHKISISEFKYLDRRRETVSTPTFSSHPVHVSERMINSNRTHTFIRLPLNKQAHAKYIN
jgi:hypothetical protein